MRNTLLWFVLVVPSCAFGTLEEGAPLPEGTVSQLHVGMTKAEVLRVFGPPEEFRRPELVDALLRDAVPQESVDASAAVLDDIFSYRYTRGDLSVYSLIFVTWMTADIQSDDLVIFFDDGGRVSEFSYRAGATGRGE